jgi:hypothetical protein
VPLPARCSTGKGPRYRCDNFRDGRTVHLYVAGIQVNFVTGLVLWHWCLPLVIVPSHIVLGLDKRCFCFLQHCLHPACELVDGFQVGLWLVWLEAHSRQPAIFKEEGRLLSGRVDVTVVLELGEWKEIGPVVLPLVDEEPEVLFQLLVHSLRLAISLHIDNLHCIDLIAL